jgi:hypothetical protein
MGGYAMGLLMRRKLYFVRVESDVVHCVEKVYPGFIGWLFRFKVLRTDLVYARRANGWFDLDNDQPVSTNRAMFLDEVLAHSRSK